MLEIEFCFYRKVTDYLLCRKFVYPRRFWLEIQFHGFNIIPNNISHVIEGPCIFRSRSRIIVYG